jgi:transcriptional antiterminator Rof (Rho-off)
MSPTPTPYVPIDCSLHDRFEAAAVRRDRVRVEWTESAEALHTVEGTIRDIVVRGGAEYLVMSDGPEIRLDRIRTFETVR